jgi:hypothetical protein
MSISFSRWILILRQIELALLVIEIVVLLGEGTARDHFAILSTAAARRRQQQHFGSAAGEASFTVAGVGREKYEVYDLSARTALFQRQKRLSYDDGAYA